MMISALLSPALSAVLLSSAHPCAVADLYVDVADPNCASGTGIAGSPVCSIGAAIAIATPGDTIRIAPGTYFESVTLPFDLDLIGTGGASVTFLDGGGSMAFTSLVTIPAAVSVTIEGLTVQNRFNFFTGGGIFVAGSLALTNSTIANNRAGGGGGLATQGADVTIDNCLFDFNTTIYPGSPGGGMAIYTSTCEISNSTLTGNHSGRGGAIFASGGDPATHVLTIENTTIRSNNAGSSTGGARGGGLFINGGRLVLEDSTIAGNTASYGIGGGISLNAAQFSITNATISGNASGSNGIIGSAPGGGMTLGGGATGSISGSTITNNYAGLSDGGGVNAHSSAGLVTVQNTIIAGNGGNTIYPPFSNQDVVGTLISLGHNLIGDGGTNFTNGVLGDLVGSTASPLNPLIGPLADNGGPTRTHALLAGSPALDAGDPLVFEPRDQRGVFRPQGPAPDIGAFEFESGSEEFCNGDGGDGMGCTPCPCGNDAPSGTIGGCRNSSGTSGLMTRSGTSSIAAFDLRFEAQNLSPNTAAILQSGTALAPSMPTNPCFGQNSGIQSPVLDGLRCIVQGVLRHGVRPANANGEIGVTTNAWGTPSSFFNFGAFMAGQTRYFQVTYRDDLAAVCLTGLNTTQAQGVTFLP